jgi:hypothetical protein
MGEMRNAYKIEVGKPKGKMPLGIMRRRWENNFKMDLRERGCGLDSYDSGEGPVAGSFELDTAEVQWAGE